MPRIYVACLASYNNGVLHGTWIDAAQDAGAIQEEVNAMLRDSKFPNVSVTCPSCEGDSADDTAVEGCCDTCKGRGEIPSAEEWAIHDYEGFAGIKISEWESFETVATLAILIEEHGEAIALFYENDSSAGVDGLAGRFEDAYRGEHSSLEDYAAQLVEDCYDLSGVPDFIKQHIDYEGIAHDMAVGGDIWSERDSDGKLHVFDNNI